MKALRPGSMKRIETSSDHTRGRVNLASWSQASSTLRGSRQVTAAYSPFGRIDVAHGHLRRTAALSFRPRPGRVRGTSPTPGAGAAVEEAVEFQPAHKGLEFWRDLRVGAPIVGRGEPRRSRAKRPWMRTGTGRASGSRRTSGPTRSFRPPGSPRKDRTVNPTLHQNDVKIPVHAFSFVLTLAKARLMRREAARAGVDTSVRGSSLPRSSTRATGDALEPVACSLR
jgi:hypothetical protein